MSETIVAGKAGYGFALFIAKKSVIYGKFFYILFKIQERYDKIRNRKGEEENNEREYIRKTGNFKEREKRRNSGTLLCGR